MAPVLLSRLVLSPLAWRHSDRLRRPLDTLLGVFSGILAYYLNETHPRTARPPEQKLLPLLRWKWAKYQEQRTKQQHSLNTQ